MWSSRSPALRLRSLPPPGWPRFRDDRRRRDRRSAQGGRSHVDSSGASSGSWVPASTSGPTSNGAARRRPTASAPRRSCSISQVVPLTAVALLSTTSSGTRHEDPGRCRRYGGCEADPFDLTGGSPSSPAPSAASASPSPEVLAAWVPTRSADVAPPRTRRRAPWRGSSSARALVPERTAVDFADREGGHHSRWRSSPSERPTSCSTNAGTIARMPAAQHPLDWWDTVLEGQQPHAAIRADPARRAADAGARSGEIRLHRGSLPEATRADSTSPATRIEVRHRRLTKALATKWASARCQRQRDRTRLHRDRQHPRPARTTPSAPALILERIPAGRWGSSPTCAGRSSFSRLPPRTTSTGSTIPVDGLAGSDL